MEWKHPSVILVTGPPYTAKTSVALYIVGHIRYCMYINLDEILDSLSPSPPPSDVEGHELMLKAFDILCRVVETQLTLGLSVVVDAQPSSRAQLDRLVDVSKSCKAAKFVIVECRFSKRYSWQTNFDKEGKITDSSRWMKELDLMSEDAWFKPKTSKDVEKLSESFDKLRLDDEPFDGVSRLVLEVDEYVREIHIVQAVQAMMFCQDERLVDYHDMRMMYGQRVADSDEEHITALRPCSVHYCKDSHSFTVYRLQEGIDYEVNCGVCEKRVAGAAYSCSSCPVAIHKACAELTTEKWYDPETHPREFLALVGGSNPPAYNFPKNYACLQCREAGKGFDYDCSACISETHLKGGRIPTVIEHDGHEHKLYFWASAVVKDCASWYRCVACGKDGMYYGYRCRRCKRDSFHTECALLPYRVMHEHGGHEHTLEMKFSRELEVEEEPDEDYFCDGCCQKMGQEYWFYECEKCSLNYHPFCAFDH